MLSPTLGAVVPHNPVAAPQGLPGDQQSVFTAASTPSIHCLSMAGPLVKLFLLTVPDILYIMEIKRELTVCSIINKYLIL